MKGAFSTCRCDAHLNREDSCYLICTCRLSGVLQQLFIQGVRVSGRVGAGVVKMALERTGGTKCVSIADELGMEACLCKICWYVGRTTDISAAEMDMTEDFNDPCTRIQTFYIASSGARSGRTTSIRIRNLWGIQNICRRTEQLWNLFRRDKG